jgi:hypothetical protein
MLKPLNNMLAFRHAARQAWLVVWLLLLLGSIGIHPAHAQHAAPLLTVTPAFGGNYAPGAWLPFDVTIQNDGPAFNAVIAATPATSDTAPETPPARYTRTVQVAAGGQLETTLYAAMQQRSNAVIITVADATGHLAEQRVPVVPQPDTPMVGIVADQPLALDAAGMLVPLAAAELPEQAPVLRNFAVLLLADTSAAGLRPDQQRALVSWVWHGGHLVLGSEAAAEQTLPELPAALRPAAIGAAARLDMMPLADAIEVAALPVALAGVHLQPTPGASRVGASDTPLWVQRGLGAGRITQLAFDPAVPALATWGESAALWRHVLQPAVALRGSFGIERSIVHMQEKHATAVVGNLPTFNLPPVRVLWLALIFYPLVLVPGLLLLLRHYGRLVWAWLVLPGVGLLLAVVLGAFAVVLRPDGRATSHIVLIEQIYGDVAHMRAFVGLLAPQDDTFWVDIPSEALVRPLRPRDTLFPTSAIDKMSGVGGAMPQQEGTFPFNVAGGQLQGFMLEQTTTLDSPAAQIAVEDTGITVHVQNPTALHLRDVVVSYGEQLAVIGDLAPDQQRTVAWPYAADSQPMPPPLGMSLSSLIYGHQPDSMSEHLTERQRSKREVLIAAAMQRGTSLADPGPWLLAWLDEPPAPAALSIRPAGAAMQQTTLLLVRPTLSGSGSIRLPPGWLRPELAVSGQGSCFDGPLPGISARNPPIVIPLRLPPDLATLQATTLSLELDSQSRWPTTGVTTELYNWQQATWDVFAYDGPGPVDISEPAPYVQNGALRLRLGGSIDEAQCLFVQAIIGGQVP